MEGNELGVASLRAIPSCNELGLPESTPPLPCLSHSILLKGWRCACWWQVAQQDVWLGPPQLLGEGGHVLDAQAPS